MLRFLIIWLGQFISLLGSELTNFAITIWAWENTGQATPLSLIMAVTQVPRLLISPFAGVWTDRFNRKYLMLLGDSVAGLSTIALLTLLLTDHLQIWHLYITGAINGLFGYIQGLAHSASISLMVAQKHYARVSALESLQMSGSYVLVPFFAGGIYAVTGLRGILTIDLMTFVVAIITLSVVSIPQPANIEQQSNSLVSSETVLQKILFGVQYLWRRPSLVTLLSYFLISNFIDSAVFVILPAMVLARSNNDPTTWGLLLAFFGTGGLLGGVTLSVWGGPKRLIHGVLIPSAIWKGGIVVLALAQHNSIKIVIVLVCGFCSPFPSSASQAIWRAKVNPDVQGRVFSTRFLLTQLATPLGAAISGPLTDKFFEPAMQPGGRLANIFGTLFGTDLGAGIALQISLFAACGMLIAIGGYSIQALRNVETCLPDYNAN